MRWRITLSHASAGTVEMSEPDGILSAVIGFERHPDFHSLVKFFKSSFRTYGSNGVEDGRREWLKDIEYTYGPDETIGIVVEYAINDYEYQVFFTGEVGVQSFIEGVEQDHYLELTFTQTGFWRKFLNRYDTVVDVQSTKDIDGNTVTVQPIKLLSLPSQLINQLSEIQQKDSTQLAGINWPADFTSPDFQIELNTNRIAQIGLDKEVINEVESYIGIPSGTIQSGLQASKLYSFLLDGIYTFDIKISITALWISSAFAYASGYHNLAGVTDGDPGPPSDPNFKGKVFIQFNEEEPIELTASHKSYSFDVNDPDAVEPNWTQTNGWSEFTYAATRSIKKGDYVRLWFENTGDEFGYGNNTFTVLVYQPFILGANNTFQMQPYFEALYPNNSLFTDIEFATGYHALWKAFGNPEGAESYIKISADTAFQDTEAQSMYIHDACSSVIDRITDHNKFYSELLGRTDTTAREYSEDGVYSGFALLKGLHLRGYALSEKLLSLSFKDIWDGGNPIFNWGLGYENIPSGTDQVIRLESKEYFYDDSEMSVLLSNVQRIKRKYDESKFYNSIECGFNKWQSEEASGIDDPQAKQSRASVLKNIGVKLSLFSSWIAAGLTIEQARRTSVKKSEDYKYDNETFIINVKNDGLGGLTPIIDEGFEEVNNLSNSATRYNKRLSPGRSFLRWTNVIFSGLKAYVGSVIRFTGGEGNYSYSSKMTFSDASDNFGGALFEETGDIPVTNSGLYYPMPFEIQHYITLEEFNIIDANRKRAIGVSQTDTGHKAFFIEDLEYEVMSGQLKITGYFKEIFRIQHVPGSSTIVQNGKIFDATFDFTFE